MLKQQLSQKVGRKPLYAHEAAICGSIAGGIAAASTTPLDVLKTRVMLDLRVLYPFFLGHKLTSHIDHIEGKHAIAST